MEEALYEVSLFFGVPVSVLLGLLALMMFLVFGSFMWFNLGTSWGFLLGVVPIVLGTLMGIFPMYLVFIYLGLGVLVYFSNLFWIRPHSKGGSEDGYYEREVHLEVPKSKPHKKPPWAK